MNKELVIAKIRRWQAELSEMIAALSEEGKTGPILDVLKKRAQDIDELIEAIDDKSFIAPADVKFEPAPVMDEIEEKVKKVKQGVKKIQKLSDEQSKIIDELGKDE